VGRPGRLEDVFSLNVGGSPDFVCAASCIFLDLPDSIANNANPLCRGTFNFRRLGASVALDAHNLTILTLGLIQEDGVAPALWADRTALSAHEKFSKQ
jgi:hypothetical protein